MKWFRGLVEAIFPLAEEDEEESESYQEIDNTDEYTDIQDEITAEELSEEVEEYTTKTEDGKYRTFKRMSNKMFNRSTDGSVEDVYKGEDENPYILREPWESYLYEWFESIQSEILKGHKKNKGFMPCEVFNLDIGGESIFNGIGEILLLDYIRKSNDILALRRSIESYGIHIIIKFKNDTFYVVAGTNEKEYKESVKNLVESLRK